MGEKYQGKLFQNGNKAQKCSIPESKSSGNSKVLEIKEMVYMM